MEHVFPPPGTLLVAKETITLYERSALRLTGREETEFWRTPWSNEKRFLEVGEPALFLGLHTFKMEWDSEHLNIWEVTTVYCWKILIGDRVYGVEIDADLPSRDLFDKLFEVRHAE